MTALIDNIAFPSSACNLSNTGSPIPTGTFLIIHETTPPMVSPSFLTDLIKFSISSAFFKSGHLTGFFSIFSKLTFEKSEEILTSPTLETKALKEISFKICLAIDPATTLHAVSLAELLPPPL